MAMKLNEIIKTSYTTRPYSLEYDDEFETPGDEDSGHFSYIKRPKSNPHVVIKKNKDTLEHTRDGFILYVKELKRRRIWEKNIHFPRVYNTTDIKTRYGDNVRSWEIEKLIPLYECSKEELTSILYRYFHFSNDMKNKSNPDIDRMHRDSIIDEIINNIKSSIKPPYRWVTDDEFKEAILILRDISKNIKASLDIHSDNIMARRTSTGIQLVFSDPFGFQNLKNEIE
jgi:hypothetical protein